MAVLYPIEGPPVAIFPQENQFTQEDLESLLLGPVRFTRKTRQIAIDGFEPYGVILAVREDHILRFPYNRMLAQKDRGYPLIWGPAVTMDLVELNVALPWFLTRTIWKHSPLE